MGGNAAELDPKEYVELEPVTATDTTEVDGPEDEESEEDIEGTEDEELDEESEEENDEE